MTLNCPRCGNLSEDAVRFCTSCGDPIVPANSQIRTTTIQQQDQIPPAAPSGRNNGRWIITIAVVVVVVILTALYFLQLSGTLTLFPSATSTVTEKATISPRAASSIIPENSTPDLTKNPTEPPQGSAIVTDPPKASPTVTKVPVCLSDQRVCGGICTDTMTDRKNCGNCSVSCTISDICRHGRCMPRCATTETSCADGCHDLLFDAENCGLCGNSCPKGLSCNNSVCTPPLKTAIPTYEG